MTFQDAEKHLDAKEYLAYSNNLFEAYTSGRLSSLEAVEKMGQKYGQAPMLALAARITRARKGRR